MNRPELYETVPFNPQTGSIRFGQTVGTCSFPEHWHEHTEMLYVEKGIGRMRCGEQLYELHAGDLLIVNANTLHGGHGCAGDFSYLCLIAGKQLLASAHGKYPLFSPVIRADTTVRECFHALTEYYEGKQEYSIFLTMSAAYRLLFYLVTHFCEEMLTDSDYQKRMKNQDRLYRAVEYISQKLSDPALSNQEIARHIHISEYYFCHIFTDMFHQSPRSYLTAKRLGKAQHLLTHTDDPVTQIALQCGLDPNYFSRIFRSKTGISPKAYRKNATKPKEV